MVKVTGATRVRLAGSKALAKMPADFGIDGSERMHRSNEPARPA